MNILNKVYRKCGDNMIWITSDLHFNHERIIGLCNRPFDSVEQMNSVLIDNWNKVIGEDDTVYILGDLFSRGDDKNIEEILSKLKGYKILIKGNHDRNIDVMLFDEVYEKFELQLCEYPLIVMSHYPFGLNECADRDVIFLHGHTHNNKDYNEKFKNRFDVGVDANSYMPLSLNDIVEKYKNY